MGKEAEKKVEDAHAGTDQLAKEQGDKVLSAVPQVKENRFKLGDAPAREQGAKQVEKKVDEGIESLQKLVAAGEEVKKNVDKYGNVYGKLNPAEEKYARDSKGFEKPRLRADDTRDVELDLKDLTKCMKEDEESSMNPVARFFKRIWASIKEGFEQLAAKLKIARGEAEDRRWRQPSLEEMKKTTMGWVAGELDPETAEKFKKIPPVAALFDGGESRFELLMSGGAEAGYIGHTNEIVINSDFYENSNADRLDILCHEQFHYASYLGGGAMEGIRWRDENGKPQFIEHDGAAWLYEGITEFLSQNLVHSQGYDTYRIGYPLEVAAAYLLGQLVGKDVLKEAYLSGDFTKVRNIVNEKLGPYSFEFIMSGPDSFECLSRIITSIKMKKVDVGNPAEDWLAKRTILATWGGS